VLTPAVLRCGRRSGKPRRRRLVGAAAGRARSARRGVDRTRRSAPNAVDDRVSEFLDPLAAVLRQEA